MNTTDTKQMENGYHLYDFKGTALREEAVEGFKQFAWRPRPERLLTKEEIKTVRKNLREYSRVFEEEDMARKNTADKAVIDERRRQLNEWLSWRESTTHRLLEERADMGLTEISEERAALEQDDEEATAAGQTVEIEEEEVLEEFEEIIE